MNTQKLPFKRATNALLGDIRALIETSRRIHTEVLSGQRAGYGEEIAQTAGKSEARSRQKKYRSRHGRRVNGNRGRSRNCSAKRA